MILSLTRNFLADTRPQDLLLWIGLVAFRLALDVSYELYLHPIFKNDSPVNYLYDVQIGRYVLSLIVFAVFVTQIRSRPQNASNVFLLITTLFLIAPLTSEYGLSLAKPAAPVFASIVSVMLINLVSEVRMPNFITAHPIPNGRFLAVSVSILFILYLIVWGYFSGATRYLSFNIHKVYDYRDEVGALLDTGLSAYANLWVYKVCTIFLICVCLELRRFWLLALVLACQVYFFGLTAHRSVLFFPLIAIGFWYYLGRVKELYLIPYASLAIVVVALFSFLLGNDIIPEILIRRAFYVPVGLIFEWFDYFNFHPNVYWSDKLLSRFNDGQYNGLNIPRLIGDFLVPGSNSAANSGMIASGFAHAGYFGVAIYSILLGLVLSFLNMIVRSGVPLWLVAALSMGPLRTAIADSDLLTSMLSHGLGIAILILWMYRNRGEDQPL